MNRMALNEDQRLNGISDTASNLWDSVSGSINSGLNWGFQHLDPFDRAIYGEIAGEANDAGNLFQGGRNGPPQSVVGTIAQDVYQAPGNLWNGLKDGTSNIFYDALIVGGIGLILYGMTKEK